MKHDPIDALGESVTRGHLLDDVRCDRVGPTHPLGPVFGRQDRRSRPRRRVAEQSSQRVETAATVWKDVVCDLASISPKLGNSTPWQRDGGRRASSHERSRLTIETIQRFMRADDYQIKFVVDQPEDMAEIDELLGQLGPIDDAGCLGGRIENGRITERRYDRARCRSRVETYWIPGFQKVLQATLEAEDAEQQKMLLYSSMFTRTLWSMTYANVSQGQCFECMRVCPVGRSKRTLH